MSAKKVVHTVALLINEMSDQQNQTMMLQFIHDLLIAVQHTPAEDISKLLAELETLADTHV